MSDLLLNPHYKGEAVGGGTAGPRGVWGRVGGGYICIMRGKVAGAGGRGD